MFIMVKKNTLKETLINFPFSFDELAVDHAIQKVDCSLIAMTIISSWLGSIDKRKRGGETLKDLFQEAESMAHAYRTDLHDNAKEYDTESYLSLERASVELIRFCCRINLVFHR